MKIGVRRIIEWTARIYRNFPSIFSGLKKSFAVNSITQFGILVILFFIAWQCLDSVSDSYVRVDSGAFSSVAYHLLHGKVLYKDAWDHKQPGIHFLNYLSLLLGENSINSIRFMERIFAVCAVFCVYSLCFRISKSRLQSLFFSLLFLVVFYHPIIFEGGNYTEEYAAVFVLLGVNFVIAAINSSHGRIKYALCLGSGFFFSCAVFFKEPFIISAIPWFLFLVLQGGLSRKSRWYQALFFFLGAFIPFLFVMTYLLINQAFFDWFHLFDYNRAYRELGQKPGKGFLEMAYTHLKIVERNYFGRVIVLKIAFSLGVFSLFDRKYLEISRWVGLPLVGMFLLEYLLIEWMGRTHAHYYLQIIGSYVLVACLGFHYLRYKIKAWKIHSPAVVVFTILGLFIFDFPDIKTFTDDISQPTQRYKRGAAAKYIQAHSEPDETIWACGPLTSRMYLEAERLSPTKYLYSFEHLFISTKGSTKEQKMALMNEQLRANPPKFIVWGYQNPKKYPHYVASVYPWIQKNYRELDVRDKSRAKLFQRK